MAEVEGHDVAKWLNSKGITGVVLEYRLPKGKNASKMAPLRDAQRALGLIRAHAPAWGCDPNKVGIMGFSAGGHLAATAATQFSADTAGASNRPVEIT